MEGEPQSGAGDGRKPTGSKPAPVPVAASIHPSASFVAEVGDGLRLVAARVQTALEARGVRVIAMRRIVEERPHLLGVHPRGWPPGATYEHVDGNYEDQEVMVAEFYTNLYTGQEERNANPAGVTRHELGHAVDETYGNFSRDAAFRAAYNADIGDVLANGIPVDPYYLQADDAGPEELFAEVFAQMHGGGTDTVTPNFTAAFPRVTRAIRQLLR